MKYKRTIFLSLILLFVLTAFNYGPMLYRRMTGNGGTWPQFYRLNSSYDNVLADFITFRQANKALWPPNDTTTYVDQKEYVYFKFYADKKYYHVWISTDKESKTTSLVFGGVSSTPSYDDAKLINRDMGYFEKERTLNYFKEFLLDKLPVKADT